MVSVDQIVLVILRLIIFSLTLGLTLISFKSYLEQKSKRLESAFVGFAFLSIATAFRTLTPHMGSWYTVYQIIESIPFIIGFSMLYVSLYR